MIDIFKTDPFEHQLNYLVKHGGDREHAIWWEQGTGKSKAVIDNAAGLYLNGEIDGLLLVAPSGLHRNFITREIPRHLLDEVAEHSRSMFYRTDKAETKWHQEECGTFLCVEAGLKVLGMSYDAFMTERGRAMAKEFLTHHRCLFVLDESGRIKNPDAKRTKILLKASQYMRDRHYRRILTGTPVSNAPWDVWSQIKFLRDDFWRPHGLDSMNAMKTAFGEWEKGVRRCHVGEAFTVRGGQRVRRKPYKGIGDLMYGYILDDGVALREFPQQQRDAQDRPRYKNLSHLRRVLQPIRSRVLKEQVLDLPPKVYTSVEFEMSGEQRRCYDSMATLGIAMLGDDSTSASLALTVMLRLQQIACGYLVVDARPDSPEEPEVRPFEPNPRVELLGEIVEDLPHQAIVWARFRHDVDQIMHQMRRLNKSCVRYDGSLSEDECAESENRFHRGDAQFFVATASKGGEGLTLNEAKTVVYYSNSFKLVDRLQSEDRAHRIGQNQSVNYIDLIARDTIDETIVDAMVNKLDIASQVTGDQVKKWISRSRLI